MKSVKYIFLSILSAAVLVSLSSCNDMLNIQQHSVSSIDTYYQTDDEAEEGIIAVYCAVRDLDAGSASPHLVSEFLSDDCWVGGGSHYDSNSYMLGDYIFGTDYGSISTIYTNLYSIIYRANVVLENVTGDSAIMKRAVAEARVFRAFANFYLVTFWGSAPLVDHTLEESEYMQGNSTVEDLWALIEDDLTEAINSGNLTEKSGQDDLTYRITKQYAQALLGKAYVYQKKYSEASTVLDQVINSGLYRLNTGYDYENFGTPAVGVTAESMFEIHYLNDISNSGSNNASMKWTYQGLRAEKYNYVAGVSPFCQATWGFKNPTKDLYDAFVAVEGVDGYRLNHSIITLDQLENDYGTTPNQEITDNEGYYDWKYRVLAEYWSSYFCANNWNVMRYAEVLLLAAEANVNAGNSSKALDYINQIRERAQAPTLSSVTMEDVKTESRLELCFEGHRFMNLIRWGDAATTLANKGSQNPVLHEDGSVTWESYNGSNYGFKSGKHELFPFPSDEIAVNPNIVQNPGW